MNYKNDLYWMAPIVGIILLFMLFNGCTKQDDATCYEVLYKVYDKHGNFLRWELEGLCIDYLTDCPDEDDLCNEYEQYYKSN